MASKGYVYKVGSIYENKFNEKFMIIERLPKDKVRIKFLDEHGYEKEIGLTSLTQRRIKNPYFVNVFGKGYEGLVKDLNVNKKERNIWYSLLKSSYNYPKKWNCLEYFIKDVRQTENYEDFLNNNELYIHFVCEDNEVIGFEVDYKAQLKKIQVRCLYSGNIEKFDSLQQASEELGWYRGTISQYCNENRVIDGYEYSWCKYQR